MNNKVTRAKPLFQLAAMLVVMGFQSVVQAQVVVLMEVNPSQSKLVATSPGNCARPPNMPGCVRASGQVQVNLNLTGNTQCANGGNWELDYVALGNSEGQTGNIDSVAAQDFDANQGTGVVNPVSGSARHILIRNNNSAAYDVWYTVIASCTGDGAVIDSDPRFENDGTGHP